MACLNPRKSFGLLATTVVVLLSWNALAKADEGISIFGHEFCCPHFSYPYTKPPCIHYKCHCNQKCICDPCNLPNYGYYPVCWRPWGLEVDYSHCPVPPPTVQAPNFNPPTVYPGTASQDEVLPPPSKLPLRDK